MKANKSSLSTQAYWHEHRWFLCMWLCPDSQVLIFLELSLSSSIWVQPMASPTEPQCRGGAPSLMCSASSPLASILQRTLPVLPACTSRERSQQAAPALLSCWSTCPSPSLDGCVQASASVGELCPSWQGIDLLFSGRGDENLIEQGAREGPGAPREEQRLGISVLLGWCGRGTGLSPRGI